jgi:hypothetical protein
VSVTPDLPPAPISPPTSGITAAGVGQFLSLVGLGTLGVLLVFNPG